MSLLDLLLDKVRQADLEQFREKVEIMESIHETRNRELGKEGIEDVVMAKEKSLESKILEVSSVSVYDNEVQQEVSKPINQPESMDGEVSPEVFDKFLQSIRG